MIFCIKHAFLPELLIVMFRKISRILEQINPLPLEYHPPAWRGSRGSCFNTEWLHYRQHSAVPHLNMHNLHQKTIKY